MNDARKEWLQVYAFAAYDTLLEPLVRKVKRGWALGKAERRWP